MITCSGCETTKSIEEYRVHKRGHRLAKCRQCENSYQREWARRDPDKMRKRKRESMARRRAADPDAARAYARLDHSANRDARTAKMREYYGRRFFWGRAMKLRGDDRATTTDVSRLWYQQRGRCILTGRRLDRSAQLDHITAKAKGGTDAKGNLRWVCSAINYAKRDMDDAELETLCADVMAWIGRRIEAHS